MVLSWNLAFFTADFMVSFWSFCSSSTSPEGKDDITFINLSQNTVVEPSSIIFTGIFVEKLENIIEGHEIKETYDNGIIIKKEEYNRFKTRKNGYKMFLVKSMIYENGKLFQEKIFEYNKYGELKKRNHSK